MNILQIGDWVTWGDDRVGRIRYFTEDGTAAFVKCATSGGRLSDFERVPIDDLTLLDPEAAAT